MTSLAEAGRAPRTVSWRKRLAARGLDGMTLLLLPGLVLILILFIYPLLFGIYDSLKPKAGGVVTGRLRVNPGVMLRAVQGADASLGWKTF